MDDRLALLVGRAILAFGELDQEVYSSITILRLMQDTLEARTERFVPKTLDKRWQLLRQLLLAATHDDKAILSKFDRFRTSMAEPIRQRAHLAHGEIREIDGMIDVSDQREGLEMSDALQKTDRVAWEDVEALLERHLNIRYSADDLAKLAKTLSDAKTTLRELVMEASRLRVSLGIEQATQANKSDPAQRP